MHFSFSSLGYKDLGLNNALLRLLDNAAEEHGVSLKEEGLAWRFQELIRKLARTGQKVVLLIDEYDKPLVDYIDDPDQAEQNRDVLKNFFSIIKDADPYLHFFIITGVSKFSKVSLFSDLNNLHDITLAPLAQSLTGYTQEELEENFASGLQQLIEAEGVELPKVLEKVRKWYNGYLWAGETRLYNPFSILLLMQQQRFKNFWWESGTPTFLIKLLRRDFKFDLGEIEAGEILFESLTFDNISWISILFQTGYVTIKDYDRETMLYTLGYPNQEVRDTMHQHLLGAFREAHPIETLPILVKIKKALEAGDIEAGMEQINSLFASLPYQLFQSRSEGFFHAILHLAFVGIGMYVESEVSTAKGRVDCVVRTKNQIYVMEFKLDAPPEQALAQIRDKRYGSRFLSEEKNVIAVGVQFSSADKAVTDWKEIPYTTLLAEG
ncbi:MAG: AAA family ATPase [Bacteroidota bacterium]